MQRNYTSFTEFLLNEELTLRNQQLSELARVRKKYKAYVRKFQSYGTLSPLPAISITSEDIERLKNLLSIQKQDKSTTLLIKAIDANNENLVRLLLEEKADPNELALSRKASPLMHAATLHVKQEIFKLLLNAKADPSKGYVSAQHTPLMQVSYYGDMEKLKFLLESKIVREQINHRNSKKESALDIAMEGEKFAVLYTLLEAGSAITDFQKLYDFLVNCKEKDVRLLRCFEILETQLNRYLEAPALESETEEVDDEQAIKIAALLALSNNIQQQKEKLKGVEKKPAPRRKIQSVKEPAYLTLAQLIYEINNPEKLQELSESIPKLIHLHQKYRKIAERCGLKFSNSLEKPYDGFTPLQMAIYYKKSIFLIKALLKAKVNPNGNAGKIDPPLIMTILRISARINPLPISVAKEIIILLLQHGAWVNQPDNDLKMTPLMWALREGVLKQDEGMDIVKLLLQWGADINLPDSGFRTPLMVAAERENPEILRLFLSYPHIQLDRVNGAGYTALDLALEKRHLSNVFELLSHGAVVSDPNALFLFLKAHCDQENKLVVLCLKLFATQLQSKLEFWQLQRAFQGFDNAPEDIEYKATLILSNNVDLTITQLTTEHRKRQEILLEKMGPQIVSEPRIKGLLLSYCGFFQPEDKKEFQQENLPPPSKTLIPVAPSVKKPS